jgi:hypothetical protein
VRGHAREEGFATLKVDEEQDIQSSQRHGIDVEEVARERPSSDLSRVLVI